MKKIRILILLSLSLLAGCYSYNDVKVKVLDSETKEPFADTYVLLSDIREIIDLFPHSRPQMIYKTDENGEVLLYRRGRFTLRAFKAGYVSTGARALPREGRDPTRNGVVERILLLSKSDEEVKLSLDMRVINDYDSNSRTKAFINYCLENKITIYRGHSKEIFTLEDDR